MCIQCYLLTTRFRTVRVPADALIFRRRKKIIQQSLSLKFPVMLSPLSVIS